MKHLRMRATAATTVTATVALLGLVTTTAHAARSTAGAGRVTIDKRVAFHLSPAGEARVAAARPADAGSDSVVSLLNNSDIGATFTVEGDGQKLGSVEIPAYSATYPEIFPAGSYVLTVAPDSGTTPDTESFTLTAGQDRSEAFYGNPIQDSLDAVPTVPAGGAVMSFRNESPSVGAVDVYVNGAKVLTDVAVGATADVVVPTGGPMVGVDETGTTTAVVAPSAASQFLASPDSYDALYLLKTTGAPPFGPNTLSLNAFDQGYAFTGADGGTFNFGSYPFQGSVANLKLAKPIVGGAMTTDGGGSYLVASDGGVFSLFGAPFLGSTGNIKLAKPIVGMATTDGTNGQGGYLLVASDGGVFAYNTPYYGSLGGQTLPAPVVSVAADPTTGAYDLALANGIVQEYGPSGPDVFAAPAPSLAKPIVGITLTPDAGGFWLVAADGGVFNNGDADFFGSAGNIALAQPITGLVPSYDGLGYSLIARDGGVFSYGDSRFVGSTGAIRLAQPIVGPIALP